ncbi:MAG: DEAD/DEAH box helicase [Pseudomonadota bacterium]
MSSTDAPNEIPADAPVDTTFTELGLDRRILKALGDIGYETPTPIQAQAIPAAMQNRDVLGIAQTGTGKTGAFTLPTIHKMTKGRARARMPRCLIVCPTRELAAQVAEDVEAYGKYLKLEMALLIGGVSFGEQDRKLTKGVDILIATPGRLLDQFERGKILMTGVETLVVDEADRMLDMGFIPDIERIFEITPFTRQVLFFSATMPPEIKRLVDQFLHQPVTVQIARRNSAAKTVTQRIARVPSSDGKLKRTALRWIIDQEDVDSAIVFCNRKRDVDIVAKSLNKHGHNAEPIHGDLPQSVRTKTLDRFKEGYIKILVASDVAARGLDVSSVSHVFNYDVPFHSEDYIHRIGRTGRAGREGDAIMLVAPLDDKNYDAILDLIDRDSIEEIVIPEVDNMPREGKGGRSRGRSSSRSGGSSRRSSSSGRSSRNRSEDQSSKPARSKTARSKPAPIERENPPAEDHVEDKPRPTRSRRKAPSRKSGRDDDKATAEVDAGTVEADAQETREDKPARSRSRSSRSRSTAKKPEASAESDRPSQSSKGGKNTGFAGDMPAFFTR